MQPISKIITSSLKHICRNRKPLDKDASVLEKALPEIYPSIRYRLPVYLISFPRSGSNFLQSVVFQSTGYYCGSLYGNRPVDLRTVFMFKSHALSFPYLLDEIDRYYPHAHGPEKTILLVRDPRDVMISFYEYVKVTKKIEILQDEFLRAISFEYAFCNNARVETFKRRTDLEPLNIGDAYKRHVNNWFVRQDVSSEHLIVRYEDLIDSPVESFGLIFDFLESESELSKEATGKLVSLYSNEERPRGKAYGWKDNQSHRVLIEMTNQELSQCIDALGYSFK